MVLALVVIAGAILALGIPPHVGIATADYREGLVTDERPLSLNPLVGATDPPVRDVGELLYRSLLRLDDRAVPTADLASGYSVSQDGLTYHLPLARGQVWSDGRVISVADVLATVEWVQSTSFDDAVTAASWRDVHIRAEGDGVSFDLAGPRASFPAQLTQLPILPLGSLGLGALAALDQTAATPMPTSGPLRVGSSTPSVITLVPNPYALSPVRVNRVEIDLYDSFAAAAAAFRAGAVTAVLANDPVQRAQLVADGGIAHDMATFRFVDLLFNERGALLGSTAVRQAVAGSIDRAALVSGPLQHMAVPETGPIPSGVAWATARQPVPEPDLAAARATLDADGWRLGSDGVRMRGTARLQLRLAVADAVPLPDLAASIASQLALVGIDVRVSSMPVAGLRQLLVGGGDFDMALADWDNGPDADVSSFWRSTALAPGGFNVSGGAVDPFLDQALDRLATLSDPGARFTAVAAVSARLTDDLPAVFLETPEVSLVVRPGIFIVLPPVGYSSARYDDIVTWHRG